jgi:hypothetical protein
MYNVYLYIYIYTHVGCLYLCAGLQRRAGTDRGRCSTAAPALRLQTSLRLRSATLAFTRRCSSSRFRAGGIGDSADGDRNAELSNANESSADRRVTGGPPCSSPRRSAASTHVLESTNNHKPYFIEHRTGFCLLGFISCTAGAAAAGSVRVELAIWRVSRRLRMLSSGG